MQYMEPELCEIVGLVFGTVLQEDWLEQEPIQRPYDHCACLRIEGAWAGCFNLHADSSCAGRMADALFGIEGGGTLEDRIEAMCEIANMLAGNVKALLPGPSSLGLPRQEQKECTDCSEITTRLGFSLPEGSHFAVSLVPDPGTF